MKDKEKQKKNPSKVQQVIAAYRPHKKEDGSPRLSDPFGAYTGYVADTLQEDKDATPTQDADDL